MTKDEGEGVVAYLARHIEPGWRYLVAEAARSFILAGERPLYGAAKARNPYEHLNGGRDTVFRGITENKTTIYRLMVRHALNALDYDEVIRGEEDIYLLRNRDVCVAWKLDGVYPKYVFAGMEWDGPWATRLARGRATA